MLSGTKLTFPNLLLSSSSDQPAAYSFPVSHVLSWHLQSGQIQISESSSPPSIISFANAPIHSHGQRAFNMEEDTANAPIFHICNHYFSSSTSSCYHPVYTILILQFSALCYGHYVILQLQNMTKTSLLTVSQN